MAVKAARNVVIEGDRIVKVTTGRPPSAATTRATTLVATTDVGCIAAGCAADLIAVDGDPLADVGVLRQPRLVIVGFSRSHEPVQLKSFAPGCAGSLRE